MVQQEYDPIMDVGCNDSMLKGVLGDEGGSVNMMITPATRHIGLEIEIPSFMALKIIHNIFCKFQSMTSNVCNNVLKNFTVVDFHVELEKDRSSPMILGWSWLTKTSVQKY